MRAKQPEPARAFPEHPPLLTLNWYVAVSTMPSLKRSKKAAGRANGKKTFRKAGVLGHLQQRAEARLKANASQHGKQPRARTLALDWPGHSQPKLHSQADPHLPLRSSRSGSLQGMVGGSAACSAMHAACTAAQPNAMHASKLPPKKPCGTPLACSRTRQHHQQPLNNHQPRLLLCRLRSHATACSATAATPYCSEASPRKLPAAEGSRSVLLYHLSL